MEEKKIKVRILPLHNIGGVGKAGDVVWMGKAEAETYIAAGYVEVVDPLVSEYADVPPNSESTNLGEGEHVIMKPQSKRRK